MKTEKWPILPPPPHPPPDAVTEYFTPILLGLRGPGFPLYPSLYLLLLLKFDLHIPGSFSCVLRDNRQKAILGVPMNVFACPMDNTVQGFTITKFEISNLHLHFLHFDVYLSVFFDRRLL